MKSYQRSSCRSRHLLVNKRRHNKSDVLLAEDTPKTPCGDTSGTNVYTFANKFFFHSSLEHYFIPPSLFIFLARFTHLLASGYDSISIASRNPLGIFGIASTWTTSLVVSATGLARASI